MAESRVYEQLVSGRGKLAVVGLGYVGLPLALEFSRHVSVLGFDTSPRTLETCRQTIPGFGLLEFTGDPDRLKEACCFIVAVSTPVDRDRNPDLDCLLEAARLVGSRMSPGSLVIFESTVYPGVTETLCAPVMEQASGLVRGHGHAGSGGGHRYFLHSVFLAAHGRQSQAFPGRVPAEALQPADSLVRPDLLVSSASFLFGPDHPAVSADHTGYPVCRERDWKRRPQIL